MIARYGECWRGIKPKVAAEHGAVGCLIYSDPRMTAIFRATIYPTGRLAVARGCAARQCDGHALILAIR